jgi:hypothetical protein
MKDTVSSLLIAHPESSCEKQIQVLVSLDFSGIAIGYLFLETQRVKTWQKPGNPVSTSTSNPRATRVGTNC